MNKPLTAKQRAEQVTQDFIDKTGLMKEGGMYADTLTEMLRVAFKEQDRDTRHACAEAVDSTYAHNACMNVSITE